MTHGALAVAQHAGVGRGFLPIYLLIKQSANPSLCMYLSVVAAGSSGTASVDNWVTTAAPPPGGADIMEGVGVEHIKHLDFAELHVTMGLRQDKEVVEKPADQMKLLEKVRERERGQGLAEGCGHHHAILSVGHVGLTDVGAGVWLLRGLVLCGAGWAGGSGDRGVPPAAAGAWQGGGA